MDRRTLSGSSPSMKATRQRHHSAGQIGRPGRIEQRWRTKLRRRSSLPGSVRALGTRALSPLWTAEARWPSGHGWSACKTAAFGVAPSRLALDPADVNRLPTAYLRSRRASSPWPMRTHAALKPSVRTGRHTNCSQAPPGPPRNRKAVIIDAAEADLPGVPTLTEDEPAHRSFDAAHTVH